MTSTTEKAVKFSFNIVNTGLENNLPKENVIGLMKDFQETLEGKDEKIVGQIIKNYDDIAKNIERNGYDKTLEVFIEKNAAAIKTSIENTNSSVCGGRSTRGSGCGSTKREVPTTRVSSSCGGGPLRSRSRC